VASRQTMFCRRSLKFCQNPSETSAAHGESAPTKGVSCPKLSEIRVFVWSDRTRLNSVSTSARSGGHPQMSEPAATSADPPASTPLPAPDPVGDVVPGDPPVPITVWHLPKPRQGTAVPASVIRRLVLNYTHPGAPVLNLTAGQPFDYAGQQPAALIITGWPQPNVTADTHLTTCATHLDAGGCLAVIITTTQIPDQLGLLVGAARGAGLTYLQHVVVAHRLARRTYQDPRRRPGRGTPHIRVHTDVLLFRRPTGTHD